MITRLWRSFCNTPTPMRHTDPDCSDLKTMPPALDGVPIKRQRLPDSSLVAFANRTAVLVNIEAIRAWKDMPGYMQRAHADGWHSSAHRNHVVYRGIATALDRCNEPSKRGPLPTDKLDVAQEVSRAATQNGAEFVAEVYAGARAGREFSEPVLALYDGLDGPSLKFNPNHAPAGMPEGGQFVSEGDGGASDKERKASLKQARQKVADAPVPTKAEVAKARADLANAARAGGDSRGGSAASRRTQRENLFKEFGGEKRGYVVCPWTGLKMSWTDDPKANPNGYPKFERGKIFTKVQGGSYRLSNLIPESFSANRSRNDKPIRPENLR